MDPCSHHRSEAFVVRRHLPVALATVALATVALALASVGLSTAAQAPGKPDIDVLTGAQVALRSRWRGEQLLPADIPILVMAGHADSQAIAGSGTSGAAVGLQGATPMDARMRDELFWNFRVRDAVVAMGRDRGLNIRAYTPDVLTINDANDPRTNWSTGRRHSDAGGYALEIHFDAYGPDGFGSGLIPAFNRPRNRLDESLAQAFGRYPLNFRGGLGAPRRGISILEVGKLEGRLEQRLRDPESRQPVIDTIARRIIEALVIGLKPPAPARFSSRPDGGDSAPQETHPPASSGVG